MKLLKNTRKKVVTLAVASALGGVAMMSAPAHAMNVAQDGKGEVLLFPYYTVKNGFDTIFSVTNTSDRTVLFKIRFREALNSREVRDFNVALSPRDVWTGGVTIDGTDGALIRTYDKSCTSPILPATGPTGSSQKEFTSAAYDGTPPFIADKGGVNLSRVQEGYFEVIEMAISTVPESSITSANVIEFATQHSAGVPRNCATFNGAFAPLNLADPIWASFTAPANVLVGNATLINVGSGKAFDATPTAIQAFQDTSPIINDPANLLPDLTSGEIVPSAFMLVDGVPTTVAITPVLVAPSVEAVSALLTANQVINEFAAGGTDTSGARTDWVVTFPTKHYYTDNPIAVFSNFQPPFAQAFQPTGQSCDPISVTFYDREEGRTQTVNDTDFSPLPSGPQGVSLCHEVNVLNFTARHGGSPLPVLGSASQLSVDTAPVSSGLTATSGWASLNLAATGVWAATGLTGLPVIGFNAISRDNTVDAGNNRNYASGSAHARNVVVAP